MKNRAKELDVDFIGGQNLPLTKAEQLSISAFIKSLKETNHRKTRRKKIISEKQLA